MTIICLIFSLTKAIFPDALFAGMSTLVVGVFEFDIFGDRFGVEVGNKGTDGTWPLQLVTRIAMRMTLIKVFTLIILLYPKVYWLMRCAIKSKPLFKLVWEPSSQNSFLAMPIPQSRTFTSQPYPILGIVFSEKISRRLWMESDFYNCLLSVECLIIHAVYQVGRLDFSRAWIPFYHHVKASIELWTRSIEQLTKLLIRREV